MFNDIVIIIIGVIWTNNFDTFLLYYGVAGTVYAVPPAVILPTRKRIIVLVYGWKFIFKRSFLNYYYIVDKTAEVSSQTKIHRKNRAYALRNFEGGEIALYVSKMKTYSTKNYISYNISYITTERNFYRVRFNNKIETFFDWQTFLLTLFFLHITIKQVKLFPYFILLKENI